jgi:uncharacterized protein (TIGR03435 family)
MKALLLVAATVAFGQTPEFEAASIKPSDPNYRGFRVIRPMPGNQSYMAQSIPLRTMMTVAYTVTDRQIAGGPEWVGTEWVGTELWDLNAKANRACTTEELHTLLQRLLEERFQLKVRREKRELPIWELLVEKGGHKMPVHDANDIDQGPIGPGPGGRGIAGKNVTMEYFAFVLSRLLERNVVDKTGLKGYFDVTLDFVREAPVVRPDGSEGPAPDGPTIFTALREQLGLRLAQGRGPVEFLVIEHVERPSAN